MQITPENSHSHREGAMRRIGDRMKPAKIVRRDE